jgi:hypothetical protein
MGGACDRWGPRAAAATTQLLTAAATFGEAAAQPACWVDCSEACCKGSPALLGKARGKALAARRESAAAPASRSLPGMAAVANPAGFIAARLFIGSSLGSFVACQFWCSVMFNGRQGGWGHWHAEGRATGWPPEPDLHARPQCDVPAAAAAAALQLSLASGCSAPMVAPASKTRCQRSAGGVCWLLPAQDACRTAPMHPPTPGTLFPPSWPAPQNCGHRKCAGRWLGQRRGGHGAAVDAAAAAGESAGLQTFKGGAPAAPGCGVGAHAGQPP